MQFSIVNKSESDKSSDFRIDAEYWHPIFIKNSKLIRSGRKIRDFINSAVLNIKSSPINRDFDYLEISRISLNGCDYETTKIKSGEEPDRAHYILQKNDVAVSTVRPNRNAVALVRKNGIVGSSGLSILRADGIDPNYLFAFCKTDYFTQCLMRANKASMYPAVSDGDILNMPILIPSIRFGSLISKFIKESIRFFDKGKKAYTQAQISLLSEFGLTNWQPRHQLTFVKNYSDTEQAGRIDADYFQPKYEEIVNTIKDYAGGWDKLGNLVEVKDQNTAPAAQGKFKYIELANIGNNGEIVDFMADLGENLPTRARRKVETGDVIISSIEGSSSSVSLIESEYNDAFCSTGFFVVKSQTLNSETLFVFFKSMLGQLQLKRGCSGTILTAIKKDELSKLILPKITKGIQVQIQKKITESFNLRTQSKRLLEHAKRAVEIAIEQDEKTAIAWLKD